MTWWRPCFRLVENVVGGEMKKRLFTIAARWTVPSLKLVFVAPGLSTEQCSQLHKGDVIELRYSDGIVQQTEISAIETATLLDDGKWSRTTNIAVSGTDADIATPGTEVWADIDD